MAIRPILPLLALGLVGMPALMAQCATAQNLTTSVCYTTIQDAINAANPSDTIAVSPGTYPESITIPASKTNLVLQSTNGASVTTISGTQGSTAGGPAAIVVDIQANGVIFGGTNRGFTVTQASSALPSGGIIGIHVGPNVTRVRIEANVVRQLVPGATSTLKETVMGMWAESGSQVLVVSNIVGTTNWAWKGSNGGQPGGGIKLDGTSLVRHNTVRGFSAGGQCGHVVGVSVAGPATVVDNGIFDMGIGNCGAIGITTANAATKVMGNTIGGMATAGISMSGGNAEGNTITSSNLNVFSLLIQTPGIFKYNNMIGGQVSNVSGATVDLTNNYWGCPTGPGTVGSCTAFDGDDPVVPFLSTP